MSKQERKSTAKAISDSAQKIWLAGLGAFSKAQAEGSRLFDELIRDGEAIEQQTRKYTKERVGQLRERMEETAERMRKTGQSSMERIQSLVDERVAKAVERMAVPTREDLDELTTKMNALNRRMMGEVERQANDVASAVRRSEGASAPKKAKAARPTPKKTAASSKSKAARAAAKSPAAKRTAKSAKRAPAKKAAKRSPAAPGKKAAARKSAR